MGTTIVSGVWDENVGNRYDSIIYVGVFSRLHKAQSRGGYWVRPVILLAHVQDGDSCEIQSIEKANLNVFVDFKTLGVSTFHHVCLLETYVDIAAKSKY